MVWRLLTPFIPKNTAEKITIKHHWNDHPWLTEWMAKVSPASPASPLPSTPTQSPGASPS